MRKSLKIKITHIGGGWADYSDGENPIGAVHVDNFDYPPKVGDRYTLVTNGSVVVSVTKITNTMYARCLNSRGCRLVENFEYEVVEVKGFIGFGESVFYVLDDGLAYASCHFTVTYFK